MRRLARPIILSALLVVAYMVWPLYTALQIRDAMHAGDTATLARKIEWDTVRAGIKASISPETLAKLEAAPDAPKPSLWQRVKAVVAPKVAGNVIDRYVTPEKLPVFLSYRELWKGSVRPVLLGPEPPTALAGTVFGGTTIDRLASLWSRVRRAVFYSPTQFELEVRDKYSPERSYVSTFELRGWEWKLTGLVIKGADLAKN
jgi:DUF2939 family protein